MRERYFSHVKLCCIMIAHFYEMNLKVILRLIKHSFILSSRSWMDYPPSSHIMSSHILKITGSLTEILKLTRAVKSKEQTFNAFNVQLKNWIFMHEMELFKLLVSNNFHDFTCEHIHLIFHLFKNVYQMPFSDLIQINSDFLF